MKLKIRIGIDQSILRDPATGEYPDNRLRQGTVRSLLASAQEDGKILNALYFPMSEQGLGFWPFSTDSAAWRATKGAKGCSQEETPPLASIRWGLAATAGALSWIHLDSNGFPTYIDIKAGFKWWIVLRRKGEAHFFESVSDVFGFFEGNYDVDKPNHDKWDLEAVLLPPGTRL
jgi:hypothetical protein